ncbi:MAG: hypothetical protein ACLQRH_17230, partial [Acidimicrobiales bacterium]
QLLESGVVTHASSRRARIPDRDRLGKGRLWAHRMGMGKVQARAPRRMYFGMSLEGDLHERRAGVLYRHK